MSNSKVKRPNHNGAKNSGAKTGYWGRRHEAKEMSKKVRRKQEKKIIKEQRDET